MKCIKCGVEYSERVCRIHEKICKTEPIKAEEIKIESNEYTLDELLQMCIDNHDIKFAPSTIKRWKEDRARKELGI